MGMRETMVYDGMGNLIEKTDFNGDTTTYEYDLMNRRISETRPWPYHETIHYSYTATGKLDTVIDQQGITTYSYDLLDNGGIPSAEQIISEYQQLEIGDAIPFTPDGNMGFPVVAIDPGKGLVMGGTTNTSTGEEADPDDPDLQTYLSGAIILFLHEPEPGTTRLIYRMSLSWNANWQYIS